MAEGPDRFQGRVGTTIREKWHVDEFISSGSMAAVYACTHRNGMRGALKILHKHLSRDQSLVKRFLREAYLANKVQHPSALKVLDDDMTEDGAAFLVMELLDGETLEQRRQRMGRLDLLEVLDIGDQLLDVLASAHSVGVVHRDLKPENVIVLQNGMIKVLDFGIAQVWDGMRSSEMTETGTILGSPSYMPPEQARGARDEIDARSDIWAAGATLFTLASNQHVHPGESTSAKLLAAASRPARSLKDAAPDVPRAVVNVIDRALAFKRDERWPDASSMREALRWARMGLGARPVARVSSTPPPPHAEATVQGFDVSLVAERALQLADDLSDTIKRRKIEEADTVMQPAGVGAPTPRALPRELPSADFAESEPTIRREPIWEEADSEEPDARAQGGISAPRVPYEEPVVIASQPEAPRSGRARSQPDARVSLAPPPRRPRVFGFVLGAATIVLASALGVFVAFRDRILGAVSTDPASTASVASAAPPASSSAGAAALSASAAPLASAPSSAAPASSQSLAALQMELDAPAPHRAPPTVSPDSLPPAPPAATAHRPRRPRPASAAVDAGGAAEAPLPNFPIPPDDTPSAPAATSAPTAPTAAPTTTSAPPAPPAPTTTTAPPATAAPPAPKPAATSAPPAAPAGAASTEAP